RPLICNARDYNSRLGTMRTWIRWTILALFLASATCYLWLLFARVILRPPYGIVQVTQHGLDIVVFSETGDRSREGPIDSFVMKGSGVGMPSGGYRIFIPSAWREILGQGTYNGSISKLESLTIHVPSALCASTGALLIALWLALRKRKPAGP